MEEWREVFKKKLKTKAFCDTDFTYFIENLMEKEDKTIDNISLEKVIEEIIWHWNGRLNAYSSMLSGHICGVDKGNFKRVANNFLKRYSREVEDIRLEGEVILTNEGRIKLI